MTEPQGTPLTVLPCTPDRWADLEQLFGPRGAYGGCWCTYFRRTGKEFEAGCRRQGAGNKEFLRTRTATEVPGLLGYVDDRVVGWVSVGSRTAFGRILRSPVARPAAGEDSHDPTIWSVVCFFVAKDARRCGVAAELLDAAVAFAADHGARAIEGYPVSTAGERVSSNELYFGTTEMFAATGFSEVERRRPRRPIMRLPLR